jgi:tetratricopeptide (TPR) repeat protein
MRDDVVGEVPRGRPINGLPLDRTIEIGKAVCEGLEFAHARGIVHRDLKPGNVWLTEDGIAKIGDFGLAVMTDRSRLTREGMMIGTVSYMPPEQATGGEITPRADLYSLGAMLYEMVTGRPPFLGDDDVAVIGQHINTPPVAPSWHNGTCPRPLEALVMRLLAKNPSERPESAQDVFNALDAIDLTARGETVEREGTSLESLAGGVFVGRQDEMGQLKAALEDVLGGRGRLVTLLGEPGIGKTRTSEEMATYAGLRGAQVLWGRCYETGGQPPYWPWVQAIRSYVREIEPEELRRQMGSSASIVAEIVTDMKERLPEVQPPPELADPDSARFRLFDSITSFLKSASQSRPLVLILDDLHWSDGPSLTFLEFVAREIGQSRILIIGTYRDMELNRRHPLTVTLGDLSRERLFERVLLRGLAATDIGRFIEIAAGVTPPPELSATVHRHTEGNPLFVTEVVRDLVQSGEIAADRTTGESTWSVRIPEGVLEVIGRRLDRLSDRTNDVLTTAAVVGRDFRLEVLKDLADDTTEGQLLDVLDEALDARIIEELTDEVGHYQFTHALMQETLTGELSTTRRVRLHARIAGSLEGIYGDRVDEHAVELAVHFHEAETLLGPDRLLHYARVAGEQALAAHGYEDAIAHFDRALNARQDVPIDGEEAAIRVGLSRAQAAAGIVRDAAENLTQAVNYYLEIDANDTAASALANVHTVTVARRMVDTFSRVIDRLPESSENLGQVLASYGLAVGSSSEDYVGAREALDKALQLADRYDDTRLKALTLANMANVDGFHMKSESSAIHARASLALNPTDEGSVTAFRARLWIAYAAASAGGLHDAAHELTALYGMAERRHDVTWMGQAANRMSWAYCMQGNWDRAEQEVKRFFDLGRLEAASGTVPVTLTAHQGDILRGEHALVVQALDNLSAQLEMGGTPEAYAGLAFSYAVAGHFDVQDDLYSTAAEFLGEVAEHEAAPIYRLVEIAASALIAIGQDDVQKAKTVIDRLSSYGGTLVVGFPLCFDRILGLLNVMTGDADRAVKHFETAIELCRDAGCSPELAWSCSDYAEMLLARDDASRASANARASGISDREKAAELQEEALSIAQELGMRSLIERILERREILRA